MVAEGVDKFKRTNILIRPDQYEKVHEKGLNLSGLVRGLLDDHLNDDRVVFSVSSQVKGIYQQVISNFGAEDRDLEIYFMQALDKYLEEKTDEIASLRQAIKQGGNGQVE